MKVEFDDTSPRVLRQRIIIGINFCNNCWQRIKNTPDSDLETINTLSQKLDDGKQRLCMLVRVAAIYDLNTCVFGQCKWNDDNFICFACSDHEHRGW